MYKEIDLNKIKLELEPPQEEPNRQYYFIAKCREKVKEWENHLGYQPKCCVITFGCQMNARDSEKIRGILNKIGFEDTEFEEEAEFILYNTCTVRENANLKVYGRLGKCKHRKEQGKKMCIALCGCMMQEPNVVEKLKSSYSFVDIIFGTHNIFKLAELFYIYLEENNFLGKKGQKEQKHKMIIDIWKDTNLIVEELPEKRKYSFKSSVNIMFGCNNFCSYCIVPYVRGRERSRKPEDIIREIEAQVANNVKEVMLLGQNVNSYGKNLEKPISFAELLQKIEQIEGLERIRFMTSHPKDLSDELIQVMAKSKKICRHLHLPVQSGSSRLLELMNRHYNKEQYLQLVDKIKKAMPGIALTTDIIVGFPGETEEDFEETMDVVRQAEYANAFTFLYSKRTGTKAAAMENQVPQEIVKDRFDRLLKLVQEKAEKFAQKDVGSVKEVLVEEVNRHDCSLLTGRLSNNILVHFPGKKEMVGQFVNVVLQECKGFYYYGHKID